MAKDALRDSLKGTWQLPGRSYDVTLTLAEDSVMRMTIQGLGRGAQMAEFVIGSHLAGTWRTSNKYVETEAGGSGSGSGGGLGSFFGGGSGKPSDVTGPFLVLTVTDLPKSRAGGSFAFPFSLGDVLIALARLGASQYIKIIDTSDPDRLVVHPVKGNQQEWTRA